MVLVELAGNPARLFTAFAPWKCAQTPKFSRPGGALAAPGSGSGCCFVKVASHAHATAVSAVATRFVLVFIDEQGLQTPLKCRRVLAEQSCR
jgi:hypothetical protein